jgi:apolipoprotein D and lipocalin family protein
MKVLLMLVVSACAMAHTPLETVDFVDIKRYSGKWYEIQRIPNSFEKGCGFVTAEYSLRKRGKVNVVNTCVKESGKTTRSHAIAKVVNKKTNASLSVSFVPLLKYLGLFGGDYNIIALDDDYQYALVGSKNREFLWILARTKKLDLRTINNLKQVATEQGFDVSRLIETKQ